MHKLAFFRAFSHLAIATRAYQVIAQEYPIMQYQFHLSQILLYRAGLILEKHDLYQGHNGHEHHYISSPNALK